MSDAETTLAFIKEYLSAEKVYHEMILKLNYGEKWQEFIQHHVGVGYQISRDLLNKIEEFERGTKELPIHPVNGFADFLITRSRIIKHCEKECPTQICGRCSLKSYSPIIKNKGEIVNGQD